MILALVMSALAQNAPRLADVRKVYVEKMDNGLDEYLRSSISKQFHGRLTIVLKREEADAILAGVNDAAQRTQTGTVTLTDPQGKVVLWSGTANDRSAKFLDLKHGGEAKLADHLIGQLRKAMEH
jgi:GTP1/Obg family GTP-binding protein